MDTTITQSRPACVQPYGFLQTATGQKSHQNQLWQVVFDKLRNLVSCRACVLLYVSPEARDQPLEQKMHTLPVAGPERALAFRPVAIKDSIQGEVLLHLQAEPGVLAAQHLVQISLRPKACRDRFLIWTLWLQAFAAWAAGASRR